MSYELDPEVVADLRQRESTTYDSTRTRGNPAAEWKSPDIIAVWPCRIPGCKVKIPVTQEALDNKAVFDRQLSRKGEEPLDIGKIMVCPSCLDFGQNSPERNVRRWQKLDRIAAAVNTIKNSQVPKNERESIEQLRRDGHPDVEGLVEAVASRLRNGGGKRERKDSL